MKSIILLSVFSFSCALPHDPSLRSVCSTAECSFDKSVTKLPSEITLIDDGVGFINQIISVMEGIKAYLGNGKFITLILDLTM
jgi:hypothetical protein